MATSATSPDSIHTPTTAWETRSATNAMQRVADVMIAVTESFRTQFREQQTTGTGDPGWRSSAPELVSPIAADDDDHHANRTISSPSRPSTAPSTFDPRRLGPVSPVSPISPTPTGGGSSHFNPADVPGPLLIARHPAVYNQAAHGGLETHVQPPEPATTSTNAAHGPGWQRGLAPETMAHPSEYPNLFEAARRIIITQRGRCPGETTPLANSRENLARFSTRTEENLPWARRSHLYQAQPLLEKPAAAPLTTAQETSLVAVTSLHNLLMFAALSQALAPALEIAASLPALSPGQHSWFTAAYTLTLGIFTLPSTRLGTIYGPKPVVIVGSLWFALWSLLAGFSLKISQDSLNGAIYLCICRAMQGFGPALTVPNAFAIVTAALPAGQRKDTCLAVFHASAPLGFVLGAVMSSLLAVNSAWDWSFFVLAAVCVSSAGLSVLVLPSQGPRKMPPIHNPWVRLDASGMALGAAGLILFSFAWNQAPGVGWRTPYTYFLLIIGTLFLAAFVYNETVVSQPLLPLRAMTSSMGLLLGCMAAGWGCFVIWAFYAFQFAEAVRGWDPLLASAASVPLAVEGFAVALLLAYLVPGGPETCWAFFASVLSFVLAAILMTTASAEQTYWGNMFVSNLLAPLGMVMASPLAAAFVSDDLADEHQGIAVSLVLSVSMCAMSLALGMARTVEAQVNENGQAMLSGFRGGQYLGLGLGGLGVLLASAFILQRLAIRNR